MLTFETPFPQVKQKVSLPNRGARRLMLPPGMLGLDLRVGETLGV